MLDQKSNSSFNSVDSIEIGKWYILCYVYVFHDVVEDLVKEVQQSEKTKAELTFSPSVSRSNSLQINKGASSSEVESAQKHYGMCQSLHSGQHWGLMSPSTDKVEVEPFINARISLCPRGIGYSDWPFTHLELGPYSTLYDSCYSHGVVVI